MTDTGSNEVAVLITLDALIAPRSDPPAALDGTQRALRRIGYVGRPIVLAGRRLGVHDLPESTPDREAWVRATLGGGGYRVVTSEGRDERQTSRTGEHGPAVDAWRVLRGEHGAAWLVSHRAADVVPAREAGLKVILIAPADMQRPALRPTYRARDLRDAVGHLLVADVFAGASSHAGSAASTDAGHRNA